MIPFTLKFGSAIGGIMSGVFLVFYLIGGEPDPSHYRTGEIVGYTTMILSMLTIFFGMRSYRNKKLGGYITFIKGFLLGILIAAFAGLIFAAFSTFETAVLMPDFTDNYYNYQIEQLESSDLPQEQVQQRIEQMKNMPAFVKHPIFQGFLMGITVFLIGLPIAIISALILRKLE